MKHELITAWKSYENFGFRCVPVHLVLKNKKKEVEIPSWKDKDYSLEDLLEKISFYNGIAIKTGEKLFVVDIDNPDILSKWNITKENLKDIPCVKTPHGFHFYFSHPENLAKLIDLTRTNKAEGIDIRGDKGIVFAPPTQIERGGKYEWLVPIGKELPKLSEKLEKFLLALFPKAVFEPETEAQKDPSEKQQDIWSKEVEKYLQDYSESKDRSGLDYHLACIARDFNVPEKQVIEVLWQPTNAKCKNKGHGDDYVSKLLIAVRRKNFNDVLACIEIAPEHEKDVAAAPAYELILNMAPNAQERAIQKLKEVLKTSVTVVRNAVRRLSNASTKYGKFVALGPSGSERFLPAELGRYLLENDQFISIHNNLYKYSNGVFQSDAEHYVHEAIQGELGARWVQRYRDEVVAWIKDKVYTEPDEVGSDRDTINVKNGMYNVRSGKLSEHSSETKSIVQLPIVFDPEAKCPRLEEFMVEIFPEDTIPLLWEYCGYILLNSLTLKKFLVLVGDANSGKSKWLEVIESAVGSNNVCNESLHHLVDRPFSVVNLFGKIANIYADLESEALKYTGLVKMLTGGDTLHAEIKHGKTFYFRNRARLFFSTNELPQIRGYDRVFFERIHIVRCPNKFILGKNADPYILDKITTEEGKSTWLNHAIIGARRLIKNERFTESPSVMKEVKEYEFSADSVSEFIYLMLETVEEGYETKETIYAVYSNWCHDVGRKPVSMKKFSRRVISEPHNFESYHPQDATLGRQVAAWNHILLTEEGSQKYDTDSFEIKSD